ncbi:MAG: hypothetical protein SFX72_12315 [Isosphaeraceae bacterium]|nr:hypothetical protein [Isosphaeraceae bacterium]
MNVASWSIRLWENVENRLLLPLGRPARWVIGVVAVVTASIWTHPYMIARLYGDEAARYALPIQIAAAAVISSMFAAVYRQFIVPLLRYLHDHLFQASLLFIAIGLVYGLGNVVELPDVVWGVTWSQRLLSGASCTLVLALLGINAYHLDQRAVLTSDSIHRHLVKWGASIQRGDFLEPTRRHGRELSRFLRAVRLPFLWLIGMPVVFRRVFPDVHHLDDGPIPLRGPGSLLAADLFEMSVWVAGILAGVLVVKSFLWIADKSARYFREVYVAAGRLIDVFRVQSRVAARRVAELIQEAWDALLRIWFLGAESQRKQMIPVPRPAPVAVRPVGRSARYAAVSPALRTQALLSFTAVFALGYAAIAFFGADLVSPGFAVFALVGIAAAIDGVFRMLVPERYRFGVLLFVLLWIGYAKQTVFELQFDHLNYDERTRVELASRDPRIEEASRPAREGTTWFPNLSQENSSWRGEESEPALPGSSRSLVGNGESLEAWKSGLIRGIERRSERPILETPRPRLVVIACSGGGIRSVHWTATALTWLESELKDLEFGKSIRLITASSAGTVGAAYYIKQRYDQHPATLTPTDRRLPASASWLDHLPSQSLGTIARAIALREVPRVLRPFDGSIPKDRGQLLEETWEDLRELPFAELRELERRAELPSLLTAPMIAEDGRRLLISNLDLAEQARPQGLEDRFTAQPARRSLTVQRGRGLFLSPKAWAGITGLNGAERDELFRLRVMLEQGLDLLPPLVQDNALSGRLRGLEEAAPVYSVSGLEFSKVFARDSGFRLSTAARMAATFPVVTPAVYLPTTPAVRVVDSGFRDNYGVELAADWLFQNREWIERNTSGVVLVQLRCFDDTRDRAEPAAEEANPWTRGFQFLTSVPEAAGTTFLIGSAIRNDRELAQLDHFFNRAIPSTGTPFFASVVFELPCFVRRLEHLPYWPENPRPDLGTLTEPSLGSLSWSLTPLEAKAIHEHALPPGELAPQSANARKERLAELRSAEATAPDEATRLAVLWEYSRARNYERLRALHDWWTSEPHRFDRAVAAGDRLP